jgi:hypothetical protein
MKGQGRARAGRDIVERDLHDFGGFDGQARHEPGIGENLAMGARCHDGEAAAEFDPAVERLKLFGAKAVGQLTANDQQANVS